MLAVALLAAAFVLQSPDLSAGAPIAREHVWNRDGCEGGNLAPRLRWSGAPAGTKSYALVMFDPDAPGGWYHWVVVDVPATAHGLDPASPPAGREGRNDFGTVGYGGPCPPPGSPHRYRFTLYALDVARLGGEAVPSGREVERLLAGHVLASATLSASYRR
jgi:Raf kinase inhibitor-like YbhB/YbcL family protein